MRYNDVSMPRTLYIIDGYAQVFRAFFAIRNGMRSPTTGEPTHAVFGITGMLLKLWAQYMPDYVLVAWDTPGKTFRDELFSDYKATRSPTPDDLKAQIPRVLELFAGFGIPVLGQPGLEADDIVACLVSQLKTMPGNEDLKIRIVSKDKDLEQLLSDDVSLFDIHTDQEMTIGDLLETKGITPPQVIDLLALTGDTVDNVPGVAGVGPKTAIQLIQEYGSIDEILKHTAELKGKLKERIESSHENLMLSRELVTLHCTADLDFSLETARFNPVEIPSLLTLFRQLGFNRYQDELRKLAQKAGITSESPQSTESSPPAKEKPFDLWSFEQAAPDIISKRVGAFNDGSYEPIITADQLAAAVLQISKSPIVSISVHSHGVGRGAILSGIGLSGEEKNGFYFTLTDLKIDDLRAILGPLLANEQIQKCGHDLKQANLLLLRCELRLTGVIFDSSIASALLEPAKSRRLEDLALERLGVTFDGSRPDAAAAEADIALRLYHHLWPLLAEKNMTSLMREIEAPLTEVLAEMETNGICCDPVVLTRQGAELALRVEDLKQQIYAAAGVKFELGSTRQVAEVLFEKLKLPAGKKTKTGYSTDVEVLEKLAAEEDKNVPHTAVPRLILEHRQLAKLISTYLGNLVDAIDPATGRIHTTFIQLAAATGRLGSNNPNLQNIPVRTSIGKQIRKAFVAPPGSKLISADYSQIELRLLAHLSGDPALAGAFAKGEDVHVAVASEVFSVPLDQVTKEQRNQAKMINYAIVYGVTPFGLSRRIEGLDVGAAAELINRYRKNFSGVDVFLQECIEQARSNGYVSTIYGRRRPIPEIDARQPNIRLLGERLAINSVVQGSAADLIKKAMVDLLRQIDREKLPVKMLLQIHDELVMEAPERDAEAMGQIVVNAMEKAISLTVPLVAECGIADDWMSAK
jgi:DNA polymerase-1